jgi:hypothetical protein
MTLFLLHGLKQAHTSHGHFLPDMAREVNPRNLPGKYQFCAGTLAADQLLACIS